MKKIGALFLAIVILIAGFSMPSTSLQTEAASPQGWQGIRDNGAGGIYIDIYGWPYSNYANIAEWGQWAYTEAGCAWFASARAKQLTGIGSTIWSGWSWWHNQYNAFGYGRGSTPRAKALACWENHVAVVEQVSGGSILMSEGGVSGYWANDYCRLVYTTDAAIKTWDQYRGSFLGYVYMTNGNWYESLPIANYGQSFYAHIVKTDVWRHIGKVNNNVELVQGENIWDGSDLWYFERQSDGSYAILNCYNYDYTSNALDVSGSGQANGTNICTSTYHGGANQRWFLHGYQNGQYYFRPAYTDKVMDLADNNNNYGTNIWLWQHNGSVAQQYGIYIIEPPTSATVSVKPGTSTSKTVINWTKTANTNKYNVVIKKASNGQVTGHYTTIYGVKDNTYSIQLPVGEYQIYVYSLNEATYVKSNTVAVSVKSGMKQFKVKLGTTSYTYSGKAKKPTVYVYVDGKKISKSYYTVSYKNNVQAGTASVSVKGKGKYSNYEGSTTFTIKPKNFTVKLKYSSYAYTGSQRKPSVSIYNGKTKISSKYYTVTYSNNIDIGTATIKIAGKGKYGSYQGKKTFTIKPAKQEILSITSPSRNRIDVIYRQDNQASGYQAQMCLYKSFKKGMLQYKGTSTAVTGTGLRSGKKYYFRVRSYKVVNGKTIYGSWSNIRSIRAK